MNAQLRGQRSVRTATAVLAGTGLGVAAAVGGIVAAHSAPLATTSDGTTASADRGQAGRSGQGFGSDARGGQDSGAGAPAQVPPDRQDLDRQGDGDGLDRPGSGLDPSQGLTGGQQDPTRQGGDQQGRDQQGWDQQGVQGVSPGQGPAVGHSHGS